MGADWRRLSAPTEPYRAGIGRKLAKAGRCQPETAIEAAIRRRLVAIDVRFHEKVGDLPGTPDFHLPDLHAVNDVDIAVFDRFRQALDEKSLVKNPKQAYRTLCTTWNRAAAEVAGWPSVQIAVPNHSRRYALAWDAFPTTFQADADAYLNRRANKNFFTKDYAKAASPSTIVLRRNQILQIATALVQSGCSPDGITSLAVLVEPENAKRALQFFVDLAHAKSTPSIDDTARVGG